MSQARTYLANASGWYDAVVVGAGPAGSVVARELARRGRQVLLVEKATFPRSKICGGCLNGAGVAALEGIGLGHLPNRFGTPLRALSLHCAGKRTTIAIGNNVVVSRDAFDMALAEEAVAEGAILRFGAEARPESADENLRTLRLTQSGRVTSVSTKVVIVAAGLNGWHEADVATRRRPQRGSRVGAGVILPECPSNLEPGVVTMSVGVGGYVGLVRLCDGRLDIAAAFDKSFLASAGGPANAASLILGQAGVPPPAGMADFPWLGTPALSHQLPRMALDRTFFVGDAAGYVEPFTGEGMAWAIESACELAPLAARAIEAYSPSITAEWWERRRQLLARRMTVCGMVGRLLRHPWLASLTTTVLARAPWLAAPLVHSINRTRSVVQ